MTEEYRFERMLGPWDELGAYEITRVVSMGGELRVTLDGSRMADIKFSSFFGFRVYDEGDLWNFWMRHGGVPSIGVYVSDTTEHIRWAASNSPHETLPAEMQNFLIISSGDVVDLLSLDEPQLEDC